MVILRAHRSRRYGNPPARALGTRFRDSEGARSSAGSKRSSWEPSTRVTHLTLRMSPGRSPCSCPAASFRATALLRSPS